MDNENQGTHVGEGFSRRNFVRGAFLTGEKPPVSGNTRSGLPSWRCKTGR